MRGGYVWPKSNHTHEAMNKTLQEVSIYSLDKKAQRQPFVISKEILYMITSQMLM